MIRIIFTIIFTISSIISFSCTNLIVTKGASADGSTMMVYTNDGEWLYHLKMFPHTTHKAEDVIQFKIPGTDQFLDIPQPSETYKKLGFHMNEHHVAIGETTFTGREELWNKNLPLKYWHLMSLALDRSKTAREAIDVITSLVDEYGYGSEGESFSIIDPNEAWILEMIGTGDGKPGAQWVAVKIPDGAISAHANKARIGTFPLDDPENCIYSENVISFAIEKGYFKPEEGKEFAFNLAYNPLSPDRMRYCESRVWSLFRRAAPEQEFSSDYHRGVEGAERYPLWIFPENKLSVKEVMDLVRDHYEGTEMDMTKGPDAGPFGTPQRWRPLSWEEENGKTYSWERPISTYNTCFSFIAQCRERTFEDMSTLWFGFDDTYFTCYQPLYMGLDSVPESYRKGDIRQYDPSSMWWAMNFVSNYANLKYSYMIQDIQKVQNEIEDQLISEQENLAKRMLNKNGEDKKKVLHDYVNERADLILNKWIDLGYLLIAKYNDGYIKAEGEPMKNPGYPAEWRKNIIDQNPGKHLIPEWNKKGRQEENPF